MAVWALYELLAQLVYEKEFNIRNYIYETKYKGVLYETFNFSIAYVNWMWTR